MIGTFCFNSFHCGLYLILRKLFVMPSLNNCHHFFVLPFIAWFETTLMLRLNYLFSRLSTPNSLVIYICHGFKTSSGNILWVLCCLSTPRTKHNVKLLSDQHRVPWDSTRRAVTFRGLDYLLKETVAYYCVNRIHIRIQFIFNWNLEVYNVLLLKAVSYPIIVPKCKALKIWKLNVILLDLTHSSFSKSLWALSLCSRPLGFMLLKAV